MAKVISIEKAVDHIKDGMTLMIGGFMAVGTPEKLIDAIVEKGVKDLTIIANDTSCEVKGLGKLIANHQVKKVIASHIGTNRETGNQMNEGILDVELSPQGTLIERIRCGGAGLGGVLTPTGLGTVVADGKDVITVDGKDFLLEKPLRADVALVFGSVVDESGNVYYRKTTRNFNPIIATAADKVIVEAEELVKVGELEGEDVMTPGIFVDYIAKGE